MLEGVKSDLQGEKFIMVKTMVKSPQMSSKIIKIMNQDPF